MIFGEMEEKLIQVLKSRFAVFSETMDRHQQPMGPSRICLTLFSTGRITPMLSKAKMDVPKNRVSWLLESKEVELTVRAPSHDNKKANLQKKKKNEHIGCFPAAGRSATHVRAGHLD